LLRRAAARGEEQISREVNKTVTSHFVVGNMVDIRFAVENIKHTSQEMERLRGATETGRDRKRAAVQDCKI
jgi:hypothetical protein